MKSALVSLSMTGNTTAQDPGGAAAVLQLTATTGTMETAIHGPTNCATITTGATTGFALSTAGCWLVTFSCDVVCGAAAIDQDVTVFLANASGVAYAGSSRTWSRTENAGGAAKYRRHTFCTQAVVRCGALPTASVRPYLNGTADAAFVISNAILTAVYLG